MPVFVSFLDANTPPGSSSCLAGDDPKFLNVLNKLNVEESDLFSYTMPNFDGNKFIEGFPGVLDFIGLVEDRYDEEGNVVYPPVVKFAKGQDYLAKWTGRALKKMSCRIRLLI